MIKGEVEVYPIFQKDYLNKLRVEIIYKQHSGQILTPLEKKVLNFLQEEIISEVLGDGWGEK